MPRRTCGSARLLHSVVLAAGGGSARRAVRAAAVRLRRSRFSDRLYVVHRSQRFDAHASQMKSAVVVLVFLQVITNTHAALDAETCLAYNKASSYVANYTGPYMCPTYSTSEGHMTMTEFDREWYMCAPNGVTEGGTGITWCTVTPNPGFYAVVIVPPVVFLAAITASCFLCKRCPVYKRRHPVAAQVDKVVVVQPMQSPSGPVMVTDGQPTNDQGMNETALACNERLVGSRVGKS